MSKVFFNEMNIPQPNYHFNINSLSHGAMTGRMLEKIEEVLFTEKPDLLMVYGDTNSTLAGTLAAVKLHIPVAHVEAGLRSFNRRMPEEANRVVTDYLSDMLFVPTENAMINLASEGVSKERCIKTGDVMYDAVLLFGQQAQKKSNVIERLELQDTDYLLVTIHRAENTDDPNRLKVIIEAFNSVAERLPVIWPLHPRTRKIINEQRLNYFLDGRIKLIDPVGYLDMLLIEQHAAVIATDSGGVQKEAFFFRVPCVTLRDETEWIELLELGWNRLAPPTCIATVTDAIFAMVGVVGKSEEPFGNGNAAKIIVHSLQEMGEADMLKAGSKVSVLADNTGCKNI